MDINTVFCRAVLRGVHADVKRKFPRTNLRKAAWVWTRGDGRWEFHGPDKFYWYGRAHNGFEARAKGWMAWLATKEVKA